MEPIRVLLVDNEEVFRQGLSKLLDEQPNIRVVYQCRDSKDVVEKSRQVKPDVILMDSQTTEGIALEVVAQISRSVPEAKVVVISHPEERANALEMLKAGAKGCFARSISLPDLIKSIELVSSGRIIVSPVLAKQFLIDIASIKEGVVTRDTKAESNLSLRETEIAKLVSQGATNKEIAEKLYISESTVKVHIKNILRKLELRNRQQIGVYAALGFGNQPNLREERSISKK